MIFINEMQDMKIYNKPFFAPINVEDKKKNSLVYLLSPNIESSKKLMTLPNMINRLYYQSYYLEKNVNYFINSKVLENADMSDTYLRRSNPDYIDFLIYESALSSKERNNLKDKEFGLPDKRKYPLHDENHIKSAIRFFNHVDKEDEEELANNIKKAIKKHNIDISISDKNRLSKYINESCNIVADRYPDLIKRLKKDVNKIAKKYKSNIKNINITFANSIDELHSYTKYNLHKTTMGFCTGNNVYILTLEYCKEMGLDKKAGFGEYYKIILHECIHAILFSKNPKCSMDFMEGICVYESGQLVDLQKTNISDNPADIRVMYINNALYVKDVIENKGYDHLIKLLSVPDFTINKYTSFTEAYDATLEYITEASLDNIYIEYSGYSSDLSEVKPIIDKILPEFSDINARFHFVLKNDDECRIGLDGDDIVIEILPKRIFSRMYTDNYENHIKYNMYTGLLIKLNPSCANTALPYAVASFLSGVWSEKVDNTGSWELETLIGKIIEDKSLSEVLEIVRNVDIDKLLDYSIQYKINIGTKDDLIYNDSPIKESVIREGFANQATMYFKIKNKQNLFKILQKHSYEGLLNLVKKTKKIEDLLYLRNDYYRGINTFKKIQDRMEKCEKLGYCKETKNYYNNITNKYLNKGVTSKDVELTIKWYKEVYYPTLKKQIASLRESVIDTSEINLGTYFKLYYISDKELEDLDIDEDSFSSSLEDAIKKLEDRHSDRKCYVYTYSNGVKYLGSINITFLDTERFEYHWAETIGEIEVDDTDESLNEAKFRGRFDLKYFTRHIKYITRKGKHKAHKIQLTNQHKMDDNKINNLVKTAPTVADVDDKNVSATPDEGPDVSPNMGSTSEAYLLDAIDESLYLKTDNMVIFTEDTSHDAYLRKVLYNDRLKQTKDVLNIYTKLKEDLPIIKYTYTTIDKYNNRNLFVDLSYYNEIFFRNNQLKLDRGIDLYAELLRRLFYSKQFDSNNYKMKTIFIPINDWDINDSTKMWFYRDTINPISVIYRIMETNPSKLEQIFGNNDILFISNNRYFKLNFSHKYDYTSLKIKFKTFINNLKQNLEIDDEDKDDTAKSKETKQAIVTNIVDKLETSVGVKLQQRNLSGGKPVDTSDSEKITTNKDSDKAVIDTKKDELLNAIDQVADVSLNTDDAVDQLEDERIKKLIMDIATQEEDTVKINNARASRMLQLHDDMLDIKLNNTTVKDLLNSKSTEELDKSDIPVTINKEAWSGMKFVNFDENYDINEDIVKMLDKLSKVSRPLSVRNISIKDNSTSEDYVDLYTVDLEDYRGKRYTIKFDVPKFKDNSYLLLRGYKKTIQNQFFNMPIIKTENDTCQIITNYNKIFVRRFGTVAGRSTPTAGKLIKAINKYEGTKIKIQFGNNGMICNKYELPIDYIDLAQVVSTIETPSFIIYFNQDEIRELYKDKINNTEGLPVVYDKVKKQILYYNGKDGMFSDYIKQFLILVDQQFDDLYTGAARSVKYTYSKCSIMSTEIPLVVVCALSEGLTEVLKKANVGYTIKEKLTKDDRTDYYNHIKFNDAYLVYKIDYNSSLLLNGLKDCDTESYSISKIDSKSMYIDFLDNFGGRIKADGLENSYDCAIDPITEEVLEHYGLPTDYVSVLLHANLLLTDNKYIKHTDTSSRRLRRQELIAVKVYKALFDDAYVSYANQLRHNKNNAQFTVKQSAVIDKFMLDSTSSDLSVINCLNDIETKNAITFKGENGLNTDRAYSLDKRTYDESMLNLVAMSTGFSGNVGITRQATVDMNIDGKRGYIKSIDGNTDKLGSSKTLSMTEAVNPFGTTRDDPFRTAMTFIQTAKHAVRTVESDPLLVTNASDEAMPYLSSDIFAFKAKQDGKVIELTDNYIILEYKDGTKDYINLEKTIEKNSDGGFYVPMKLDKIDRLKEGSKFKAKEILAYDKLSFSNSLGENDNIAFNVGTLTKVAVINTDEGFEDSTIITSTMSERMATDVIMLKEITLDKDTIVSNLVEVNQPIEEGDTLLVISNSHDEEMTNVLMKNLIDDENEISELGRKAIKSPVTGKVAGIKVYRTIDTSELSKSLQKIVKKYEDPVKKMKKKLDDNNIASSDLQPTYALPTTGKLKNAIDAVRIEIYLEVHDILSVGDKIVMDRANKGIIKDIIPADLAPYTDFRPNEEVSVFANVSSFNKRMVISPLIIGSINKLLIELDRSVKDILEIPYDDSKI